VRRAGHPQPMVLAHAADFIVFAPVVIASVALSVKALLEQRRERAQR
jgi:hypothetical protein